jgi:GTP-binding protein YchF
MKVALIGPPQSGKTTLFTAVTGQAAPPAQTGLEHVAIVHVPDPRLAVLAEMRRVKRTVPAALDFVDFPGVSLAVSQGQNEFRRHAAGMRTCDALVVVLRAFENEVIPPYRDRIDPAADLEELRTELAFADLDVATGRVERLRKQVTKPTPTQDHDRRELALLERCQDALENDRPISSALQSDEERQMVSSFAFLTQQPLVLVVNVSEAALGSPPVLPFGDEAVVITLSAEIEAEIAQLDEADRPDFLADLGIGEPARDSLIHACYQALGLISFLTWTDEEVRAWSVPAGTPAIEAAGKVHSDMARGFIRAETISFDDLAAAGDMKAAKAAGKVRLEGKTYLVQDGDVIQFRFNV